MRSVTVVVFGSIYMRIGGSIYDRWIVDGLRARGWRVDVQEVDLHDTRADVYAGIPDVAVVFADGLVFSARSDQVERYASWIRFVALVHLPLAAEPKLPP